MLQKLATPKEEQKGEEEFEQAEKPTPTPADP